jgi:hypothetical protein
MDGCFFFISEAILEWIFGYFVAEKEEGQTDRFGLFFSPYCFPPFSKLDELCVGVPFPRPS